MATAQALDALTGETRAALRAHTRQAHEALHRLPLFTALSAGTLDRPGYATLLQRLHFFHAGTDALLHEACERFRDRAADYRWTPRAHWLARDLAFLGVPPTWSLPPPATAAANALSLAEYAGIAYVVEGSLLGAAVLERAARRLLAAEAGAGCAYWTWCREVAGLRIAAMGRFVEAAGRDSTNLDAMIAAAERTFGTFAACFPPADSPVGASAPATTAIHR